jgi:hypothetical protein
MRGSKLVQLLESTTQWREAGERASRRRAFESKRRKIRAVIGLLLLSIFAFAFLYPGFQQSPTNGPTCNNLVAQPPSPSDSKHVALIDELATDQPDPGFVDSINASSRAAGFLLDYFPPSAATLDLFRTLPIRGYSMIIFRNHGPGVGVSDTPGIATSQPYNDYSWVWDQLNDRLAVVQIGGHTYFAITPRYISDLMCGQFSNTIVMAMFCNSATFFVPILHSFVEKGASSFIGWNSTVSVPYDDLTFSRLVPLVLQGEPVSHAVHTIMTELGPDPVYGGTLNYYPE